MMPSRQLRENVDLPVLAAHGVGVGELSQLKEGDKWLWTHRVHSVLGPGQV